MNHYTKQIKKIIYPFNFGTNEQKNRNKFNYNRNFTIIHKKNYLLFRIINKKI